MVVSTNSPKVRLASRVNVQLLLSQHDSSCTSCVRSGNCTLQSLANDLGIYRQPYREHLAVRRGIPPSRSVRDNEKCVKCLRCVQVCEKVQAPGRLGPHEPLHARLRGRPRQERAISHGRLRRYAASASPTAPRARCASATTPSEVLAAIADPKKTVMVQVAPAVRASWGEEFGLAPEASTIERLAAVLHAIGADYVFDTDFSADLTIMEEGSELLARIAEADKGGPDAPRLPLMTSCCPGWVRYVKAQLPAVPAAGLQLQVARSRCSAPSPRPTTPRCSAWSPRTSAASRSCPAWPRRPRPRSPTMQDERGSPDVDAVLTVRELCRLDPRLAHGPGQLHRARARRAAWALAARAPAPSSARRAASWRRRSARPTASPPAGTPSPTPSARSVAPSGWREATFDLDGRELRAAVAHGLANARALLDALEPGAHLLRLRRGHGVPRRLRGRGRAAHPRRLRPRRPPRGGLCAPSTPRPPSASATRTPTSRPATATSSGIPSPRGPSASSTSPASSSRHQPRHPADRWRSAGWRGSCRRDGSRHDRTLPQSESRSERATRASSSGGGSCLGGFWSRRLERRDRERQLPALPGCEHHR